MGLLTAFLVAHPLSAAQHEKNDKDNAVKYKKNPCSGEASCRIKQFNLLRQQLPNEPAKLGSSTALQAQEYLNMPLQAGNNFSTGLKLEYDTKANKYSLPALRVANTFDLVPSAEEAGSMYSEVLSAGFEGPPAFTPRDNAQQWYVATMDDENFYYTVWGGGLFDSLFGGGAASLFICRRQCDAKLLWVKSIHNYTLTKTEPTWTGSSNLIGRVALAVNKDRLYITTMFTGVGPQLFAINKSDGSPIWTMAYQPPEVFGQDYFVSPDTPLHSLPNGFPSITLGDLNVTVAELEDDKVSVFVGIASFQNAVNFGSFGGFPEYNDQGALIRVDDLGNTAEKVWTITTCAQKLNVGDTISNADPDDIVFNSFRPGTDEVLIFRETTATGVFDAPNGVYGKVLDYNGANPGYIPVGYPSLNNETMPIVSNVFLAAGNPPVTEANLQNVWRNLAPGIGSTASIYTTIVSAPGPLTATDLLIELNAIQSALGAGQTAKVVIWGYLDQSQVDAVDAAAWGASNAGVRYIAALPTGYTIANDQEARALNYYGNSLWAQAPVIDVRRNLIYFGTSQTHDMPVDEVLFYQDPAIDYFSRKQPVIDTMYQYARIDDSTIGAPFSTLEDVNNEKKIFIDKTVDLSLAYNDRSPRGNRSYCDAIMAADLTTGEIEFGFRSLPSDAATFITDDPVLFVIRQNKSVVDGDMSSGIMYYDNIQDEQGNYGTYLAAQNKASCFVILDISGYNPNVVYDHKNLLEKGVVPTMLYAGPDGALGGSNYGSSQDGGSQLFFSGANAAAYQGSYSYTYNTGYYLGYEFAVTQDGRVFPIQNSYAASVDVGQKKIVWETPLGQRSHAMTNVYNGIVYMSRGDGTLFAFDAATGKVVWKLDGNGEYGFAGINTPTFSDGKAVWIDNYTAAGGIVGGGGGTGVQMRVDKNLLPTTCDTVRSLTRNRKFCSYDVLPKSPGPSVFELLVDNEEITHSWSFQGELFAKHTALPSGQETQIVLKAKKYIDSSQQIIFESNTAQQGIRYLSLTFFNRDGYILEYQLYQNGEWINKQATFKKKKHRKHSNHSVKRRAPIYKKG